MNINNLLTNDIYSFEKSERVWEFTTFDEPIYLQICDDWWQYVSIPVDWRINKNTYNEAHREFLHYFGTVLNFV